MQRKKGNAAGIFLLACAFCCTICLPQALAAQEAAPELEARSAVLMDENGVILFEKNSHEKLPPASVTKAMTILLAVEAVEAGKVSLEDPVVASENAWRQGGSQIWLKSGETMTYREMLTALAVVSANDAAVAIMEHLYGSEAAAVEAMNARAASLGLQDTHFANVNGLPAENHYLSAHDTARIVQEAVRHPLYMEVCSIKEYWLRGGKNWLVNTNKLLWWYEGADGLKTGWTEAAKYCFAGTAKRDGLRLISVVLAAPQPRSHLRESMKLLDWGFARYKASPVVAAGERVAEIRVRRGKRDQLPLVAAGDLQVLARKDGAGGEIERQITLEPFAEAPVAAGQVCGRLVVWQAGKACGSVDLIAAQAVEEAGFFDTLRTVFTKFFAV